MVGLGAGDLKDCSCLTPSRFERPVEGPWVAEDLLLRGVTGDGWLCPLLGVFVVESSPSGLSFSLWSMARLFAGGLPSGEEGSRSE